MAEFEYEAPLHTVGIYLAVTDAKAAIAWYEKTFGAKVASTVPGPEGKLMHADLRIGDSQVMLADIFSEGPFRDPRDSPPSLNLHVYVEDVDAVWERAIAAGATVVQPLADQFWGDRFGMFRDPFGHTWAVAFKSKLSDAELAKIRDEAMAQMGGA